MATTPVPSARTFTVSQRLLRGYGPLAVFAVLVLLMSLLVPSKSPKSVNAIAGSTGASEGPLAGGTTDTGPAGSGEAAGGAGAGGAAGGAGAPAQPGRTGAAPGQT